MTDVMVAGASPDFQDAAMAADPAGETLAGSFLTAIPDLLDESKREAAGAQYDAARSRAFLLDTAVARQNREVEAYDQAIGRVKAVTGVGLENPLSGGYWRDVLAEAQASGATPEELRTQWPAQRVHERAMAIFDQKLAELRARNPYYSEAPELRFDLNAAQAGVGREAERAVAAADAARTGNRLLDWGAGFAGGTMGAAKTPEFWAGTALTAPLGGEGGFLLRTGKVALAGGVANAAITAADQPIVQADRVSIGLPSGFGEAADNVKNSFLYGALGAGAFHVGGEAIGAAVRGGSALVQALRRRAPPGSGAAEAVRGADVAAAASDLTLQKPAGVSPDAAQTTFAEALDAAHEPGSPAPLGTRPLPEGLDDAPARQAIAGAGGALDQAERLRADPALVDSALASDDPQLRAAGAVADLGEVAFGRVRAGEIPADQAAIVGLSTDDPNLQAALVTVLKEGNAQDVAAARAQISDYLAAASARDRAVATVGARPEEAAPKLPAAELAPVRPAAPAPRPVPLIEFLASIGGIKMDKISQPHDLVRIFVPGQGKLLRKKGGLSLDKAREAAIEAGYPIGGEGAAADRMATTTLNDFLTAIDQDHRASGKGGVGARVTRIDDQAHVEARATEALVANEQRLLDDFKRHAHDEGYDTTDHEFMARAAAHYYSGEYGFNPGAALERAARELEAEHQFTAAEHAGEPIPGWDDEILGGRPQSGGGPVPEDGRAGADAGGQGQGADLRQAPGDAGGAPGAPGAEGQAGQLGSKPPPLRDLVPWVDEHGTTQLITRDELAAMGNRDEQLAFLVSTCGAP